MTALSDSPASATPLRIGVDIGGTNTDAVVVKGREVIGAAKAATTVDVLTGASEALRLALASAGARARDIAVVAIGTTQFTNAFVERAGLARTAVLRVCLPSSRDIEPMLDWPEDLRAAIGGETYLVSGGYDFAGRTATMLDEEAIRTAARDLRLKGYRDVAVSGVFSTIDDAMERRARDIIAQEAPHVRVTISSEVGGFGLIERENAAIMNASLRPLSEEIVAEFMRALAGHGLEARTFFSQNDGSLMTPARAARHPILTFASGPANSLAGARRLTGQNDAIVVDIGGTTSDVGAISGGASRETVLPKSPFGVRTNFRAPDILSIGLGGGSVVRLGERPEIGPQSVGRSLGERALVFGGDTLTATDVAVAAGRANLGDRSRLSHLREDELAAADDKIQEIIADAIDALRTSGADLPAIIVGGGRFLASDALRGVGRSVSPDNADVANAIGAAFGSVSAEAEQIWRGDERERARSIADLSKAARERALREGADPATLFEREIEALPLPYTAGAFFRLRVRVMGELNIAERPDDE